MSRCPSREQLDEFALRSDESPELDAGHVAACPRCAARVAWVRREAEVVRKWAAQDDAPVGELWSSVQARIRAGRTRRWLGDRRWLGAGLAVAAAAAVALVVLRSQTEEREETRSAAVAIDGAEAEYRRAAEVLETQAAARAHTPEQRKAIAQARKSLQRARAAGASDTAGRVRVMEGYAVYLRSLRRALRDDQ
jgi:hypothetical protein